MIAIEPRYDMACTRELLVTVMNDRCQEVHWRALVGHERLLSARARKQTSIIGIRYVVKLILIPVPSL